MKAKRIALQTTLNTAKIVVFFRSYKELLQLLVLNNHIKQFDYES